ncbi:CLUMA_CG012134, isoform A [Clunio marinus]|uniref:CLUMA_CG012134, isoform A n=1 Tax=Clunio marinus TaxID=568069 RepID=A0A1J1IFD0_9DIPT|nr:CLUMA_CG012134, isoform A [Clunio marinus]
MKSVFRLRNLLLLRKKNFLTSARRTLSSLVNKRESLLPDDKLTLQDFLVVGKNLPKPNEIPQEEPLPPYLKNIDVSGENRKVYFDVYGCQMNVNDTEIVWSILKSQKYQKTENIDEADVILLMTCSIREGAENKIWNRLVHLKGMKKRRGKKSDPLQIGILGCMAERLKTKIIEQEKDVDVVAGPDSYKDLPRLLALGKNGVRIKEVTLLGQNVNSFRDLSKENQEPEATQLVPGFKTVYKTKVGGLRFAELLERIANVSPELRIRFTSPHPKDFPSAVLEVIAKYPNICKSLHIPAQSGNSSVLERMRRGYTREAYLELISRVRKVLPNVSISSDFICGFCGETEEEFNDTLTLIDEVKYNVAYLFPYSMREKTTAFRKFQDDVPHDVKIDRLNRMIEMYRRNSQLLNQQLIGTTQLILIENQSKRSKDEIYGRCDGNIKVIIPKSNEINVGDYVAVEIVDANSQGMKGKMLGKTLLKEFYLN